MDTKLTRRDFLKVSTTGLAAWTMDAPSWAPRLAFTPQGEELGGDILVCVFLRGGMDALNAVIPQFEDEYYRLRPSLAIPESKSGDEGSAIDLDGKFGLHPALRPLKDVWDDGQLAIVHAVGSPDPTHSHFDAMDYMERGTPGEKGSSTGWIGRHLLSAPWGGDSPFRAVGMGGVRQTALRGPVPVTSLQSIADFHLQGDPREIISIQETLASLYTLEGSLAEAADNTLGAVGILERFKVADYAPEKGVEYHEGEFGLAMKQVAQLAKTGVGLEAACVDMGGFDTHANQGGAQGNLAGLLETLAQGLAAFYHDMRHQSQTYSVVTMSEFGRRAEENGNAGSDHGHGGVMFTLGSGAVGGQVYTDWPGLAPETLYGPAGQYDRLPGRAGRTGRKTAGEQREPGICLSRAFANF